MARKNKLDPAYQTATAIIGIVTQHRDFRLAHFMNQELGLQLSNKEDLPVYNSKTDSLSYFPFFYYHHPDLRTDFCLIANSNGSNILLPSMKQINYFFVLVGAAYANHVSEMISNLRKIQGIQAALQVNQGGSKDIPPLLEDLELHRIDLQKKEDQGPDSYFHTDEE